MSETSNIYNKIIKKIVSGVSIPKIFGGVRVYNFMYGGKPTYFAWEENSDPKIVEYDYVKKLVESEDYNV